MSKKMFLIFKDGTVFEGKGFGAENEVTGEFVFTTDMIGYENNLSDKGYYGQIVMQTFATVGNYGFNHEAIENSTYLKGYVVREWCEKPSNFMCEGTLDEFLKLKNITGIYGVDTRAITKFIRENGTMNAMISSYIPDDLSKISDYKLGNVYPNISKNSVVYKPSSEEKYRVTLIDFGVKKSTVDFLNSLGCTVNVVPHNITSPEILKDKPDGIVLSEGPESISEYLYIQNEIKNLIGECPILALSVGHQILAAACGGKLEKLPYGHRGSSQPVKHTDGIRTYITHQNHGFIVSEVPSNASVIFKNANDGSCEGLYYTDKKAISVQFDIDTSGGPHDTSFIYTEFLKMMEEK